MTLRETYIQGLIAALTGTVGLGAEVGRSIVVAFARPRGSVLVVHRGGEELENTLGDDTERHCEILVSVITRSDVPDQVADQVMEIAHPVIMGYQAAGMIQMQEMGTNAPVFANTDGQACMLTSRYRIQYSTDRLSLSA